MPVEPPETRVLTPAEQATVRRARDKAFVLYEGVRVGHRSCGIALAETFGVPTRPYQALRRGGVTGEGYCGSIKAGELLLGELLGDPDPAGPVTPALRAAVTWYQQQVPLRIDRGGAPDFICNSLTAPRGEFMGPARKAFCTELTATVAELTAEALLRFAPEIALEIADLPAR